MTRLVWADGGRCLTLFDFVFESKEPADDEVHVLKGIDALMLQAYMCGFATKGHTKSDGPAVGIPNYAAGGLGGEHADAGRTKETLVSERSGAAGAAGFFVGDESQADTTMESATGFLDGTNGIKHGNDAALHVAGATPKKEMVFSSRLELLRVLRGDDVIVAVEIECAANWPVSCKETRRSFLACVSREGGRNAAAIEAEVEYVTLQEGGAGKRLNTGRIFRGNSDELGGERSHFFGVCVQPITKQGVG